MGLLACTTNFTTRIGEGEEPAAVERALWNWAREKRWGKGEGLGTQKIKLFSKRLK